MLMVNSIKLTENMATFVKKRMSLRGTVVQDKDRIRRRFREEDALDDRKPMGMPVQAVQGRIRGSSPNTSCEVLPLASVYGLSVEVMSLVAHKPGFIVGRERRGKIVKEVYPIERMQLLYVRQVHRCRRVRRGVNTSRWQGEPSSLTLIRGETYWPRSNQTGTARLS